MFSLLFSPKGCKSSVRRVCLHACVSASLLYNGLACSRCRLDDLPDKIELHFPIVFSYSLSLSFSSWAVNQAINWTLNPLFVYMNHGSQRYNLSVLCWRDRNLPKIPLCFSATMASFRLGLNWRKKSRLNMVAQLQGYVLYERCRPGGLEKETPCTCSIVSQSS